MTGRPPHNLTGLRAGRLVAVERQPNGFWLCRCDCGGAKVMRAWRLKRASESDGRTSCGCARRLDLTGQKFGLLTAVSAESGHRWSCRCECGGWKIVTTNQLTRTQKTGYSISCGCAQVRRRAQRALPAGPRKDTRTRRSAHYIERRLQWQRACRALSRVFGAPPEDVAEAVRMAKRLRAHGTPAGAALRNAMATTHVSRDALVEAILRMPGAVVQTEYVRVA